MLSLFCLGKNTICECNNTIKALIRSKPFPVIYKIILIKGYIGLHPNMKKVFTYMTARSFFLLSYPVSILTHVNKQCIYMAGSNGLSKDCKTLATDVRLITPQLISDNRRIIWRCKKYRSANKTNTQGEYLLHTS